MIYQMSPADRPDDDIIANDVKLDAWYEQYQRDLMRKLGKQQHTSAVGNADVHQFSLE